MRQKEKWRKVSSDLMMFRQISRYQYRLNTVASVQGKVQLEYFCTEHSQKTTIAFLVSGHIITWRSWYRTKLALFFFESWHWSTRFNTALYIGFAQCCCMFLWGTSLHTWTLEAKGSATQQTPSIRTPSPPLSHEIHTMKWDTEPSQPQKRPHTRTHWHVRPLIKGRSSLLVQTTIHTLGHSQANLINVTSALCYPSLT